jgi:hypothetical protein
MQTQEPEAGERVTREAWSVNSLADLYDCSTKTIRRAISAGQLETLRIGSAIRVTDESRRRWAASLRQSAAA